MLVVIVHVHVKEECIEAFREISLENAKASIQEAGIFQFDVLQQNDDATQFVLIEVYRDDTAPAEHKKTAHYQKWRDMVADMMAEPRYSLKYHAEHPPFTVWEGRNA